MDYVNLSWTETTWVAAAAAAAHKTEACDID